MRSLVFPFFLYCNDSPHTIVGKIPIGKGNVHFIQQFVKKVHSFSSQYGGNGSISYAASNIIGGPNIFPNYGDFVQAFAMVCVFSGIACYCHVKNDHNFSEISK